MSPGDLLLVQIQRVWRRFAPAAVLIGQHGCFGHLHTQGKGKGYRRGSTGRRFDTFKLQTEGSSDFMMLYLFLTLNV